MKVLQLPICLTQGHIWGDSRQRTGWQTCRRCHMRRRDPWIDTTPAGEWRIMPAEKKRRASRMRTVVVAARKGGSGKTTLAVQLALASHLRGRKAVLADADPQRSAVDALRVRVGKGPRRMETGGLFLEAAQAEAEAVGTDDLIIDTPGGPGPTLSHALAIADVVLLVARPTFLDIAAAVKTLAEARAAGVPSLIVLNQAPPARSGQEVPAVAKAIEALTVTNLPVSRTILRARAAYQTSVANGRSVEELGASPAAVEIAALWAEVEAMLETARIADASAGAAA